jgi:UDP-glucose 6-dehydrogenase
MRISIPGMGYVGVVSGTCLARDGQEVMGVDPVQSKVDDLAKGCTPIQEPSVAEMLDAGHEAGRLAASTDPADGVEDADMVWVCAGPPSLLERGIVAMLAGGALVSTRMGIEGVEERKDSTSLLRTARTIRLKASLA